MKTRYEITIEYGSDFQKEIWRKTFSSISKALKEAMEKAHKENRLEVIEICPAEYTEEEKKELSNAYQF